MGISMSMSVGGADADAKIFASGVASSQSIFGVNAGSFRFLAITPFERPDLRLAQALRRQRIAVAIDIGRNFSAWSALFDDLAGEPAGLGLKLPEDTTGLPAKPPACVSFVIAAGSVHELPPEWRRLPIIAQVCSLAAAEMALGAGAGGLIAKGQESGGRVGDENSFVLLQRLVAMTETRLFKVPVWCQGGVGLHTAPAAVAGGAFGVVLDAILAGYPECACHRK